MPENILTLWNRRSLGILVHFPLYPFYCLAVCYLFYAIFCNFPSSLQKGTGGPGKINNIFDIQREPNTSYKLV